MAFITIESAAKKDAVTEQFESVQRVLNVNELLNIIVGYAIYRNYTKKEDGKVPVICRDAVKSLRLVSKSWLAAVTSVLRHSNEPLFQLKLTRTDSVHIHKNETLLDKFVTTVMENSDGSNKWVEHPHTFSLKILRRALTPDNQANLMNCFAKCSKSLVKLEVDGSQYYTDFETFPMPKLRKLVWKCEPYTWLTWNQDSEDLDTSDILFNLLFQPNAATGLEEFVMRHMNAKPSNLAKLILPLTITKLDLYETLTNDELQGLVKNELPNLRELRLGVDNPDPEGKNILSRIIHDHRKKLLVLSLKGLLMLTGELTTICLGKMKALKTLEISTVCVELPQNHGLDFCCPNLTELKVNQTAKGFLLWLKPHSVFPEINSLSVDISENVKAYNVKFNGSARVTEMYSLELQVVKEILRAFPKWRKNVHPNEIIWVSDDSSRSCLLQALKNDMSCMRLQNGERSRNYEAVECWLELSKIWKAEILLALEIEESPFEIITID